MNDLHIKFNVGNYTAGKILLKYARLTMCYNSGSAIPSYKYYVLMVVLGIVYMLIVMNTTIVEGYNNDN